MFLLLLSLIIGTANADSINTGVGGAENYKAAVANVAALPPVSNSAGDTRIALDTFDIYVWNGTSWVDKSTGGGGGAVTSVFGRSGVIVATAPDYASFYLQQSNNLSDVASASTSRTNLGLGSAATQASTFFAQVANNLSDLASAATARVNLALGNVDNTSDANKPISTATAAALALKAPLASPALTGNPTAPTQTAADNSTKIATTAYADNSSAAAASAAIVQTITNGDTTHASSSGALFTALAAKEPTITGTTSADYWTGAKTFVNFNTSARSAISVTAPMTYNSGTGVITTPSFIGDNFGGSMAGLVPAATSGQFENGSFLNAGGAFSIVDQSKPRYGTFKLVNMTAQAAGVMKFTDVIISPDSRHAYVSGGQNSMSVYNIQNQAAPKLEGTISLLGSYRMCQITIASVPYLVVPSSGGSTLYMVNVSNPTSLSVTGSLAISGAPGSLYNCAVGGNYVYLSTQNKGLTVVDVSTPTLPVQVYQEGGTLNKSFGIALASNGTTLYTTNYDTAGTHVVKYLKTWDVTTPTAPSLLNTYTFPGNTKPNNLTLSGNYAYVTDSGLNQILVTDITTPTAPNQVAAITPTYVFDSGETAQLSANGNFAYIPSGGGAGANGGAIDLYDVTTKASPIKITTAFTNVANSVFGGITMNNGYIYAADYGVAPGSAGSLDVFTTGESVIGGNILTSTATFKSLTPSTALASDANDNVVSSSTTATELGYVHGVTSAIQTQINTLSAGSVTAVTGTAPIVSSGGTTPAISCITATGSVAGCLSAADFTTFAAKQAAGNYITTLTGDGAASGPGSSVLTLATVNTNVGTFGSPSETTVFTVNGKGLITAAVDNFIVIDEAHVTGLTADLGLKANLASPALTGMPTAPTQAPGDNSTKIATTAYTDAAIAAIPAGGTVTAVSVVSANGLAGTSSGGATPALTLSTTVTGVLKGDGTTISTATSGTDYSAGTSGNVTGIVKSTTGTGALTTAIAADFPTLNQSTTGNAATATALQTARTINGVSFDGTANINIPSSTPTVSTITSATTGASTIGTYFLNVSGGSFTFTLPAASTNTGVAFILINKTYTGSNFVTTAMTGGDTLNGGTTDTIGIGETRKYKSDGSNWFVEY